MLHGRGGGGRFLDGVTSASQTGATMEPIGDGENILALLLGILVWVLAKAINLADHLP